MIHDDAVLTYIQGRMSADEIERFEAEITKDANLAAEVAALQAARHVMAAEKPNSPEAGWDRLSQAIDKNDAGSGDNGSRVAQAANDNRPLRFSLAQVACVVAAAIACWQFVALPFLHGDPDGYSLSSTTEEKHTLQIRFTDTASLGDISQLLYQVEGTMSGGPSAIGIYRVTFEDAAALTKAANLLRGSEALVAEVLEQ